MFFRKNRKAQEKTVTTVRPTAHTYEVWYKDSIGRWTFASKHTNKTDARRAVETFTIAQAEIREIY